MKRFMTIYALGRRYLGLSTIEALRWAVIYRAYH